MTYSLGNSECQHTAFGDTIGNLVAKSVSLAGDDYMTKAALTRKESKLLDAQMEIFATEPAGDDIALVHAVFCHVGFPRSKQSGRTFKRKSGQASILLEAGSLYDGENWIQQGLPYGAKPRLLTMHITREYKRTKNRVINLGDGITAFARDVLSIGANSRSLSSLREQANALAAASMRIGYRDSAGRVHTDLQQPFSEFAAWGKREDSKQSAFWGATVEITPQYAAALEQFATPIDMRAVAQLQGSALALDVYMWLAHRLPRVTKPILLPWQALRSQFGQEYGDAENFRKAFKIALRQAATVYPSSRVETPPGGLRIFQSKPAVPKSAVFISKS